jgi:hypothetical protein
MDVAVEEREGLQGNSRRKKVLFGRKSVVAVFLLCLVSTVVAVVFYM